MLRPVESSSSAATSGINAALSADGQNFNVPADVKVREELSEADWRRIYLADPFALPTQSPDWARAVSASGVYSVQSRHYVFPNGREAVLPLFKQNGPVGVSNGLWSPPSAWGFGGTLSNEPLGSSDIAQILDDVRRMRSLSVHIRPNPLHSIIWEQSSRGWTRLPRRAHILDLDGGFDSVWRTRFKPRTRTAIRKAEASGVEVRFGNSPALIDAFYGLWQQSLRRWARHQNEPSWLASWRGKKRDPIEKLYAMSDAMGDIFRVWVAFHDEAPVAAIIVLQDRNAHYTRGAMNEEVAGDLMANYLLHSRAIEAACTAGCRFYQMGETGNSNSLSQFKSRFGAVGTPYYEYLRETLPLHEINTRARNVLKRMIGFRDA
jgi:hypothetical protein